MVPMMNALALRALADGIVRGRFPAAPRTGRKGVRKRGSGNPTCAMDRTTDPSYVWYVAEGIAVVTQRFHPARASVVCGIAVKMLIRGMTETIRPLSIGGFALGVIRMAPHLTPEHGPLPRPGNSSP